jgi:hypothetical protein
MTETKYLLRPDAEVFEMVDGRFAGRRFEHGRTYEADQIPPEHMADFEALERRGAPEADQ